MYDACPCLGPPQNSHTAATKGDDRGAGARLIGAKGSYVSNVSKGERGELMG